MKNLKIILVAITILISSLINISYARGGVGIENKLEETIKFTNGSLALEKNQTEFVKVSFRINKEGTLDILQLNYSNEKIKNQLLSKLSEIVVEDSNNSKEVYNYNFLFKKL
jgi:hypothetical protein